MSRADKAGLFCLSESIRDAYFKMTHAEFESAVIADAAASYFVGQLLGAYEVVNHPQSEDQRTFAVSLMDDAVKQLQERLPEQAFWYMVIHLNDLSAQARAALESGEIVIPAETTCH